MTPGNDQTFLSLSVALTGFSQFDLQGTGMCEQYFRTARENAAAILEELLYTFKKVEEQSGGDPEKLEQGLRHSIMADPKFGPLARNIIKMWYLGSWYELPGDWRAAYGESPGDVTFVISSEAYLQGLAWKAMQAHPMGGKETGFGTWAHPPIETRR